MDDTLIGIDENGNIFWGLALSSNETGWYNRKGNSKRGSLPITYW